MKTKLLILVTLFLGFSFTIMAQSEDEAIKTCLNNYLEGLTKGDTARLNKAFHPTAVLKTVTPEGAIRESTGKRFVASAPAGGMKATPKILSYSYAGVSATAALELVFTDFKYIDLVSLLKFGNEWKIVCRVYSKAELTDNLVSPMGGGSSNVAGKSSTAPAKKAAKKNDGWD